MLVSVVVEINESFTLLITSSILSSSLCNGTGAVQLPGHCVHPVLENASIVSLLYKNLLATMSSDEGNREKRTGGNVYEHEAGAELPV